MVLRKTVRIAVLKGGFIANATGRIDRSAVSVYKPVFKKYPRDFDQWGWRVALRYA